MAKKNVGMMSMHTKQMDSMMGGGKQAMMPGVGKQTMMPKPKPMPIMKQKGTPLTGFAPKAKTFKKGKKAKLPII